MMTGRSARAWRAELHSWVERDDGKENGENGADGEDVEDGVDGGEG
jgi:hypothetical protein